MSCSILLNKKEVLRVSGSVFDTISQTLMDVYINYDLQNTEVFNFIEEMQLCSKTRFPAVSISDYVQTDEAISILVFMIKKAIDNLKYQIADFVLDDLQTFYKIIEEYKITTYSIE